MTWRLDAIPHDVTCGCPTCLAVYSEPVAGQRPLFDVLLLEALADPWVTLTPHPQYL